MECNNITRFVLPAIRISMAEQLGRKYKLNQKEIAERLGVAQVAVSKYLNGNYSESVRKIVLQVRKSRIADAAAIKAAKIDDPKTVEKLVNELCLKFINDDLVN